MSVHNDCGRCFTGEVGGVYAYGGELAGCVPDEVSLLN